MAPQPGSGTTGGGARQALYRHKAVKAEAFLPVNSSSLPRKKRKNTVASKGAQRSVAATEEVCYHCGCAKFEQHKWKEPGHCRACFHHHSTPLDALDGIRVLRRPTEKRASDVYKKDPIAKAHEREGPPAAASRSISPRDWTSSSVDSPSDDIPAEVSFGVTNFVEDEKSTVIPDRKVERTRRPSTFQNEPHTRNNQKPGAGRRQGVQLMCDADGVTVAKNASNDKDKDVLDAEVEPEVAEVRAETPSPVDISIDKEGVSVSAEEKSPFRGAGRGVQMMCNVDGDTITSDAAEQRQDFSRMRRGTAGLKPRRKRDKGPDVSLVSDGGDHVDDIAELKRGVDASLKDDVGVGYAGLDDSVLSSAATETRRRVPSPLVPSSPVNSDLNKQVPTPRVVTPKTPHGVPKRPILEEMDDTDNTVQSEEPSDHHSPPASPLKSTRAGDLYENLLHNILRDPPAWHSKPAPHEFPEKETPARQRHATMPHSAATDAVKPEAQGENVLPRMKGYSMSSNDIIQDAKVAPSKPSAQAKEATKGHRVRSPDLQSAAEAEKECARIDKMNVRELKVEMDVIGAELRQVEAQHKRDFTTSKARHEEEICDLRHRFVHSHTEMNFDESLSKLKEAHGREMASIRAVLEARSTLLQKRQARVRGRLEAIGIRTHDFQSFKSRFADDMGSSARGGNRGATPAAFSAEEPPSTQGFRRQTETASSTYSYSKSNTNQRPSWKSDPDMSYDPRERVNLNGQFSANANATRGTGFNSGARTARPMYGASMGRQPTGADRSRFAGTNRGANTYARPGVSTASSAKQSLSGSKTERGTTSTGVNGSGSVSEERATLVELVKKRKPWFQYLQGGISSIPLTELRKVISNMKDTGVEGINGSEVATELEAIKGIVVAHASKHIEDKTDMELALECRFFNRHNDYLLNRFKKRTHYERLGIDRGATTAQIKKGFMRMALSWHPDNVKKKYRYCFANEEVYTNLVKDLYMLIDESYRTLSDSGSRGLYDNQMRSGRGRR